MFKNIPTERMMYTIDGDDMVELPNIIKSGLDLGGLSEIISPLIMKGSGATKSQMAIAGYPSDVLDELFGTGMSEDSLLDVLGKMTNEQLMALPADEVEKILMLI